MGLTVFLGIFLGGDIILSGLSDRLLLSRYLIYGLVLGSFDLMRKRHVESSLILGILLIILISELALNLLFLAFLTAFVILALISVYTIRVDTESGRSIVVGELNWKTGVKAWSGFTTAILIFSVILFLLMPRLTSRQATQANWLPSRLDLGLSSPITLPSKPGTGVSPGIFPSFQNGTIPGDGTYALLGYTGSQADTVVMNIRSRVSSYWRGSTLDEYDGRGWLRSSPEIKLRNELRGEFILPDSRLRFSEERVYWQSYYILVDQPNAIFTGYNPGRIYLPEIDQTFLGKGTFYRALSLVPYFSPALLKNDRVASEYDYFLALPSSATERTAILAESIVRNASTDYDKAARLERFLLTNYPYQLDVDPLPPGRDAADYFLFEQQAGYCANFATTMAVMARQVDLPARVATGYLPGYIDPLSGAHIVRAGDAHAWVEIFFFKHGWVAFDPTPRGDAAMGFTSGRNWLYFGLEDITGLSITGLFSPLTENIALDLFTFSIWIWLGLPILVFAIAIVVYSIVKYKVKRKQKLPEYACLQGEARREVLDIYVRMIRLLSKRGLPPKEPYQSPYEYAEIIYHYTLQSQNIIEQISYYACKAAYDPGLFKLPDKKKLKQSLTELKRIL